MSTIGVITACVGIGAGTYMYLNKNKAKKKIDKYMSYLDNK